MMLKTKALNTDANEFDTEKTEPQYAKGGNPNLSEPVRRCDGISSVRDTDDRTLMMLQAFEGRA
jgi:hypothetical protein